MADPWSWLRMVSSQVNREELTKSLGGWDESLPTTLRPRDPGKPWENHGKTMGKWWLNGILWDLPSGKLM